MVVPEALDNSEENIYYKFFKAENFRKGVSKKEIILKVVPAIVFPKKAALKVNILKSGFLIIGQYLRNSLTSPLICSANQWTGFYMIRTFVMKELTEMQDHSQ